MSKTQPGGGDGGESWPETETNNSNDNTANRRGLIISDYTRDYRGRPLNNEKVWAGTVAGGARGSVSRRVRAKTKTKSPNKDTPLCFIELELGKYV